MFHKIYYSLGKFLESKKKWELAIGIYLKIQSDDKPLIYYRLAFCYKKRKDYGNAIYFLKKGINIEKTKPHWYFNLADSLLILKKEILAIEYLREGLSVSPENKNYIKKLRLLSKKLDQGIPEIDTFISSISELGSTSITINVIGNIKEYKQEKLHLELTSRKNKFDLQPYNYKIAIDEIIIDEDGIFNASFILPLEFLTKNTNTINYSWNFYVVSEKKKKILKYFEKKNHILKYQNFEIIPYQTKDKSFSILSIRKESKEKNLDKNHITLVISRVDEESNFTQNIIRLANILVSLNNKVTLLALDLKVNQNVYAISPKINFDYISTILISQREENIDFFSSNIIPPHEYSKELENYLSNIQTDILYIPIFGKFILNKIIALTDNSTQRILADYNKKRYISYSNLLSQNHEQSIETIINKVHSEHFFNNIESISAIHLIYTEAKPLFEQITNNPIIATSLNEANIIEQWSNYLEQINNKEEEVFY